MKRPLEEKLRASTKDTPLADLIGLHCIDPKHRAQSLAWRAKQIGVLVAEPCAHCGRPDKSEMHHRNYYRPLDVTWLCHKCHVGEHIRLGRARIVILGADPDRRFGLRSYPDTQPVRRKGEAA